MTKEELVQAARVLHRISKRNDRGQVPGIQKNKEDEK